MITVLEGNAIEAARRHIHARINLLGEEAHRERQKVKAQADEWLQRQVAYWNRSRGQKRRFERQRQIKSQA